MAYEDAQQGRLARAVGSDETDAAARVDAQVDGVEDRPGGVLAGDLLGVECAASLDTTRPSRWSCRFRVRHAPLRSTPLARPHNWRARLRSCLPGDRPGRTAAV